MDSDKLQRQSQQDTLTRTQTVHLLLGTPRKQRYSALPQVQAACYASG